MDSRVNCRSIGLNASLKPFKVKAIAVKITSFVQSNYLLLLSASSLSGSCMASLRPLLRLFSKVPQSISRSSKRAMPFWIASMHYCKKWLAHRLRRPVVSVLRRLISPLKTAASLLMQKRCLLFLMAIRCSVATSCLIGGLSFGLTST